MSCRSWKEPTRLKLQLRLEAFNLTNTVWFGSPGTTVATSPFGVITPLQANDPRFAQVGARLMFWSRS